MDKCENCERNIPAELLSPMFMSGGEDDDGYTGSICGVCALKIQNKEMGLERKSFQGEIAEYNRLEAIKHYKKTNQK